MNVFITIDYELFMGKISGSVEKCLITPMDNFTGMLDNYGIKTTVFVDAAYLLRMKQLRNENENLRRDFELVSSHIKQMSLQGHDIQMHFHPQWLYSEYNDGMWKMDFDHYKLSDMSTDFLTLTFSNAKLLLESIIEKKVIAFRAGGYSLSAFWNYKKMFIDNGIKIDSSVLRNACVKSKYQEYDYRNIPSSIVYNFEDDILKENKNGNLKEISISTTSYSGFIYCFLKQKLFSKYKPRIKYGDGIGIGYPGGRLQQIFTRLNMLFRRKIVSASLDNFMSALLLNIYLKYKKKMRCTDFVIIGHPKSFSDLSISNVEQFILKVKADCTFLTASMLKK